jgi:hypothetical protein
LNIYSCPAEAILLGPDHNSALTAGNSLIMVGRPFTSNLGGSLMIHEQRIYTCIPGKLPALLSRFENHTLKIWERHGIKQAGFWTVLVGEGSQDLHYMLAWDSLADREKKWNAFQADPAWHQARDESEKNGPLIANIKSAFLRPAAFSAVK